MGMGMGTGGSKKREFTDIVRAAAVSKISGTRERIAPAVNLYLEPVDIEGSAWLALKEPSYNHKFVKGFMWANVTTKGKKWPFDRKRGVRYIPLEDVELLMEGLQNTYKGATLWCGAQSIVLE